MDRLKRNVLDHLNVLEGNVQSMLLVGGEGGEKENENTQGEGVLCGSMTHFKLMLCSGVPDGKSVTMNQTVSLANVKPILPLNFWRTLIAWYKDLLTFDKNIGTLQRRLSKREMGHSARLVLLPLYVIKGGR